MTTVVTLVLYHSHCIVDMHALLSSLRLFRLRPIQTAADSASPEPSDLDSPSVKLHACIYIAIRPSCIYQCRVRLLDLVEVFDRHGLPVFMLCIDLINGEQRASMPRIALVINVSRKSTYAHLSANDTHDTLTTSTNPTGKVSAAF